MFQPISRTLILTGLALLPLGCATGQTTDGPDGRTLFAQHCAACHGMFGEGDGPVAAVMPVPNLRTLSARAGGEFPRDAVMQYIDGRNLPAAHGERLMPVWGDTFADDGQDAAAERIAAITDFVEQLQN